MGGARRKGGGASRRTQLCDLIVDLSELVTGDGEGGGLTCRVLHIVPLVKDYHLASEIHQHLGRPTGSVTVPVCLPAKSLVAHLLSNAGIDEVVVRTKHEVCLLQ